MSVVGVSGCHPSVCGCHPSVCGCQWVPSFSLWIGCHPSVCGCHPSVCGGCHPSVCGCQWVPSFSMWVSVGVILQSVGVSGCHPSVCGCNDVILTSSSHTHSHSSILLSSIKQNRSLLRFSVLLQKKQVVSPQVGAFLEGSWSVRYKSALGSVLLTTVATEGNMKC
uniref:Uncharacterized protein n=1 Tax=Echeneis naucrates TaxID=173247 RepID=A0A665UQN6_ECHNA